MRLTHGVGVEVSRLLFLKFLNSLDGALALYSSCNQERLDQRPWLHSVSGSGPGGAPNPQHCLDFIEGFNEMLRQISIF